MELTKVLQLFKNMCETNTKQSEPLGKSLGCIYYKIYKEIKVNALLRLHILFTNISYPKKE